MRELHNWNAPSNNAAGAYKHELAPLRRLTVGVSFKVWFRHSY